MKAVDNSARKMWGESYDCTCNEYEMRSHSPTQLVTVPDHWPLASHFLTIDPWSLYPALQSNTRLSPYVNLSPILKPFAKDPGSPQLTTEKEVKGIIVRMVKVPLTEMLFLVKLSLCGH